jgi:hypothetical protein
MDSGDKAANKAMSAALKYALTQTLILPFAAVDGDADAPPASTPKAAAPAAAPQCGAPDPKKKSAYDGRALKPGEDPRPAAEPEPPGEGTAFHSKLYNAMTLCGIAADDLKAYLVKRGIITAAMDVDNLPDKIVAAMLDGKDKKTGKDNWELITTAIKQAKGAKQ